MLMYVGSDWGSWVASSVWMVFHLAFVAVSVAAVVWVLSQLRQQSGENAAEK